MEIGFQRRTDLALSALRVLAKKDRRLAGVELASQIGTTSSFLPQVMTPLLQAGWVTSERGPGGGYQIADSAFDAHLLDVIEATEGPTDTGACVFVKGAPCPGEVTCPVHHVWVEARQVLLEGFTEIPALTPNLKGEMS